MAVARVVRADTPILERLEKNDPFELLGLLLREQHYVVIGPPARDSQPLVLPIVVEPVNEQVVEMGNHGGGLAADRLHNQVGDALIGDPVVEGPSVGRIAEAGGNKAAGRKALYR